MSSTRKPSLETLPTEILHQIYDELDSETIVFSMRIVSKRFYSITNVYNRLQLDFRYISKSHMRMMARLIDPQNVISLTLADVEETSGQIQLFLSHFSTDRFIRLHSLTLTYLNDEELDQFAKLIQKSSLRTVSISFMDPESNQAKQFLTSILVRETLRTLKLGNGDWVINGTRWPKRCKLQNMIIFRGCDWDIAHFIVKCSSNLRKLTVRCILKYDIDKTITLLPDMKPCNHLSYLSLCVTTDLTIEDVEVFLGLFPKLTYLELACLKDGANYSLFDGRRWEDFIQTKLPLLDQIKLDLVCSVRGIGENVPTVESLIAPFRSLFWKKVKHLVVNCDEEYENDYHKFHLYSTPRSREEFDYSHRRKTIVKSISNIADYNQPIIINTKKLTLDLNPTTNTSIQENTSLTRPYIFQKVTELELLIEQEWPINAIKHLSTMVNLLTLQTICLNFKSDCNFIVSLDTEVKALFEQTLNLRSIRIICNDDIGMQVFVRDYSEKLMFITRNSIALNLPRHIKTLDIEVKDVEDAKTVLEHNKYLARVTFRPIYRGERFSDGIAEWMKNMNRDDTLRNDWGVFCGCDACDSIKAVHLWLYNKLD
ncbi:unnamed protein product [Adineta ricciae]|uniref:F-box domain-containing protein n=1 Tax=Adineta ricciae TaxID=249248 RepID=A0A816FDJ8_ADIRI|nr:unnamed protein product [Adineta ricciae]CAF1660167.1 unnamed protein product [Adineta ricciae]